MLTGADLTVADVEAVARHGAPVALDVHARERMEEARDVIVRLVEAGEVVYGVTTGFGSLADRRIDPAEASLLPEHLLVSHAAGVGRPFPREVVRAMLVLRANTLALGHSGCRPLLVDRICRFLELGLHPVVPEQGSVGASGDLAPLAHLALPLIGRGEVELGGQVMPALLALREVGLEPLALEPKEGLALLNGTQLMGALGALLAADAERLVRTASVAAAMSVEALLGTEVAFAAPYQLARPHPGQVEVAAELRRLLHGSGIQASHHGRAHKVQDPYSLRCVPQVHGAIRDALGHLDRVLEIELNSATDNPLVFPAGGAAPDGTVATGGGTVLREANRQALRACMTVVYLRAIPEDLARRMRHDSRRPLLQGATDPLQRLRALHHERDPLYRSTAHFVVETGRPSVHSLVNMVLMQLELAGVVPLAPSSQAPRP